MNDKKLNIETNDQNKEADSGKVSPSPEDIQSETAKKKKNSITGWIIAACCVLALSLCVSLYLNSPNKAGSEVKTRTITLTSLGFDTPITFKTTCSEDEFNEYLSIIKSTYTECNELFDAFNTYEDTTSLKAVNEKAHDGPVEVDEKVIEVLNDSIKAHNVNPKFDVSQGKLTFLWKQAFDTEPAALPDEKAIADSINHESMNGVVVKDDTIELTDPQADLDFGAIAKGLSLIHI